MSKNQKPWNIFHITEFSSNQLRTYIKRFFNHVNLYGVRASKEIEKHEFTRLFHLKKHMLRDILNLSFIWYSFYRLFKKIGMIKKPCRFHQINRNRISKSFFLSNKVLSKSLDLFIIAKNNPC